MLLCKASRYAQPWVVDIKKKIIIIIIIIIKIKIKKSLLKTRARTNFEYKWLQ